MGTTPGLRKAASHLAVQRAFRPAAGELEATTGVRTTGVSVWRMTQQVAQEEISRESSVPDWHLKPIPQSSGRVDPCPLLAIDPDGTYCHNQDKTQKDHEIKVAVLYTGKQREHEKSKRWRLEGRQIVLSAPGEEPREFFNRVTHKAMSHYGAHRNTQVVIHGDGDPWIKRLQTNYWDQALVRLDPWHVMKKMREVTGQKSIRSGWKRAIYGDPDRLIFLLQAWKVQKTRPRSEGRKRMEELVQYIRNNREGLLPSGVPKEVKEKHPRMFIRGSGTIESHVGHAFASRFKQSRMSWSREGLKNLCYLREKFLNGDPKPRYKVPDPITRRIA